MQRIILALAVFAALCQSAYAARDSRGSGESENMTRPCVPRIGSVTVRLQATTGTDADSGALNLNTTYMMRCDTAAWVRFGASAVTAVANDWQIGAGEVFYIPTGGSETMRHVSALSVTTNGDCRLLECL